MDKPKNKGGRPRKNPLPEPETPVTPDETTATDTPEPETPPVFTPMDTDREPTPVKPLAYEGKVNAIVNGEVTQLYLDGGVQVIKTDVFNKIFTLATVKEAATPAAEKGNWSFTLHTPAAVPAQFRRPNGTFDTVAMSDWLEADPANVKAGIPGYMIGHRG